MKNLKMLIEYDGTDFSGWQYQPGKRTVQGNLETALKELTSEDIRVIGAGRTDQGVHALCQVANFHTLTELTSDQIQKGLNSLTNDDIYIKRVDSMGSDFHSRYSAKSKLYRYHIISKPSPLKRRYNWFVKYKLNVSQMKEVVKYLLDEHDFEHFSVKDGGKNTRCTLSSINLTDSGSQIIIAIEGNRFLKKMVRGIVGFMYDVGRGRFTSPQTEDVFRGRIKDIYFAPPHGLFLVDVKY
jgi:tRNA pseudouridine38-40 synthase